MGLSKSIEDIINSRLEGKSYKREIQSSKNRISEERALSPSSLSVPTLVKSASKVPSSKIFEAKKDVAETQVKLAQSKSCAVAKEEIQTKTNFGRTPTSILKLAR